MPGFDKDNGPSVEDFREEDLLEKADRTRRDEIPVVSIKDEIDGKSRITAKDASSVLGLSVSSDFNQSGLGEDVVSGGARTDTVDFMTAKRPVKLDREPS